MTLRCLMNPQEPAIPQSRRSQLGAHAHFLDASRCDSARHSMRDNTAMISSSTTMPLHTATADGTGNSYIRNGKVFKGSGAEPAVRPLSPMQGLADLMTIQEHSAGPRPGAEGVHYMVLCHHPQETHFVPLTQALLFPRYGWKSPWLIRKDMSCRNG